MANSNWAERYSNEEKVILQKGDWTLTEDGEKVWSLYHQDKCVEPVLVFNKFKLFDKGFLLYCEETQHNSYALYFESNSQPIFTLSGPNTSMEAKDGLIIFKLADGQTSAFETTNFMKVYLANEDQLSFDL